MNKSKSKSQTRKRASPPLDDALLAALLKVGIPEENARILAATVLTTVGTYEPKPSVATKAQAAAEANAEDLEAADPSKVKKALTEASREATQQQGGSPIRWSTSLLGYTPATVSIGAIGYGAMMAIRHVLIKAGCDSRVINIACYMVPCLINLLPEIVTPGSVPGASYAPPPSHDEKPHAE